MFRDFIIEQIVTESETIKSFYLRRADGLSVDIYLPGQYVSLRVKPSLAGRELIRTYTLSNRPGKDYFRLTIKREKTGLVSTYLHDKLKEGDRIEVSKPTGNFYLSTDNTKPVVLLSGGVGITPMLSMAEYLATERPGRKLFFLHTSRNKSVQPMLTRLRELASGQPDWHLSVFHSEPLESEQPGVDYDHPGRISKAYLAAVLPGTDVEVYLCGPFPFIETMYQYLTGMGVREENICYEFFGEGQQLGSKPLFSTPETAGFKITFNASRTQISWDNRYPSILEAAEAAGLTPVFSCRMGTCASCETTLLKGTVEYDPEPFVEVPESKLLLCCAKPVSDLEIDL